MHRAYLVTLSTAATMLVLAAPIAPISDPAVRKPLPASQLIVEDQQAFTNESILIWLSASSATENESLTVEGLAAGTRLSAGAAVGTSRWQLPLYDLNQVNPVWVYPPTDFIGVMYVVINLLSPDQRLVDSRAVQLKWVAKNSGPSQPGERINSDNASTAAVQPMDRDETAAIKNSDSPQLGERINSDKSSTAAIQPKGHDETATIKKSGPSQPGEHINSDNASTAVIEPMDRDETAAIKNSNPPQLGERINSDKPSTATIQPKAHDEPPTIKQSGPSQSGERINSDSSNTAAIQPKGRDETATINKLGPPQPGERINSDSSNTATIQPKGRDETAAIQKSDPLQLGERSNSDNSSAAIIQPADRDETATILMKRGLDFLKTGDIAAARIAFQRVADAGIADGALALATTYDRRYLPEQVVGVFGDDKKARAWYGRAMELGSREAGHILAEMVTK